MERKKGFFESTNDFYLILIAIGCILVFFSWIGGCMGCHQQKPVETKIEKTIKVLDKKWDKWLDEQNSDTIKKDKSLNQK